MAIGMYGNVMPTVDCQAQDIDRRWAFGENKSLYQSFAFCNFIACACECYCFCRLKRNPPHRHYANTARPGGHGRSQINLFECEYLRYFLFQVQASCRGGHRWRAKNARKIRKLQESSSVSAMCVCVHCCIHDEHDLSHCNESRYHTRPNAQSHIHLK